MDFLYRSQLIKVLLLLFLGFLLGQLFAMPWVGMTLSLLTYLLLLLRDYRHFNDWLEQGGLTSKPLVNGFWSAVIDQVDRRLKKLRAEKRALRADVDYFKESFEALESGVLVIDRQGRIDWCNRAAQPLLGVSLQRDRGQLLVNLLRAPALGQYLDKGDFERPLEFVSPRKAELRLEIQATTFRHYHTLIFIRDISEVYYLEQMRQDFVANVSHELRTPLTVIQGYLETLQLAEQSDAQVLPPHWETAVSNMLLQSRRMDAMVEDLILLSRLESLPATEVAGEWVSLHSLLEEIVADAALASAEKCFRLEMEGEDEQCCLRGNRQELYSVFANLIQNATKYTAVQGEVVVSCRRKYKQFVVAVADDGIGIEALHIPRLTERFYRVDNSRNADSGGSGLGLAIVKHILTRHDAELTINSRLGVGSEFRCSFPLERFVASRDEMAVF